MNTLIVPCAGESPRFSQNRPKWMFYYPDGKMMVEKALEGLDLSHYDKIVFTIVSRQVELYQADIVLSDIFSSFFSNKMEICILENNTTCQAETVYETIRKLQIHGSFAVKDSDNYISFIMPDFNEYVVGINVNTFEGEIEGLNTKSFLVINNQNIITDIIEKQIVSSSICVGMYGFSSVETFNDAYLHLRDVSDDKYEIYLSHVISYIVGMKKAVYRYIEAVEYEDWGTINDWHTVLSKRKTIIINLDGILFRYREKYGSNNWKLDPEPMLENIEWLKILYRRGNQILLLTSMDKKSSRRIELYLESEGIHIHQIVTECYLSHKVLIDSFSEGIPYPGCVSLNIKNDECLKDYLGNQFVFKMN